MGAMSGGNCLQTARGTADRQDASVFENMTIEQIGDDACGAEELRQEKEDEDGNKVK